MKDNYASKHYTLLKQLSDKQNAKNIQEGELEDKSNIIPMQLMFSSFQSCVSSKSGTICSIFRTLDVVTAPNSKKSSSSVYFFFLFCQALF